MGDGGVVAASVQRATGTNGDVAMQEQ